MTQTTLVTTTGGLAADLPANAHKVTNLGAPSAATDAATKGYVDATAVGLVPKANVAALGASNVALSTLQTVDGVVLLDADRVLLVGQTTGSQNGLWVAHAGAWTRPTDYAAGSSQKGDFIAVTAGGTTYGGSQWVQIDAAAITVNTDSSSWTQFASSGSTQAGSGLQKVGNTISVSTGGITSGMIADATITDADVAAANKDGAAGTASMRTLGVGASQAAAGNDSRMTDARTPVAHHLSHEIGGSDPLTSFLPVPAGGTAGQFLELLGISPNTYGWATPAAGSSGVTAAILGWVLGTDPSLASPMVPDGQVITDGTVVAGTLGTVTSASNPFVLADVGKVIQLKRDAVIANCAMSNGSNALVAGNNDIPSWVVVGTGVLVDYGVSGSPSAKLLSSTVASVTDSGHITLADNCTNPAGVVARQVTFYNFHQTTIATYVGAGSVTLTAAAPYAFAGAVVCWGTDNRAAHAAVVALAASTGRMPYIPTGKYLELLTSANPFAMAAWTNTTLTYRGAGRKLTHFMIVHDVADAGWNGGHLQAGSNGSIDAADWSWGYYGPQINAAAGGSDYGLYLARIGTLTQRHRFARIDSDSTYRPKYATSVLASTANSNTFLFMEDCNFYGMGSANGYFVNPTRTVTDAVLASNTTITSASIGFIADDVDKTITGTGIPAGTRIKSVESSTSATMTAAATVTGSGRTVILGGSKLEIFSINCRFDTSMVMQTTTIDEAYHPHATYIHPSVSYLFIRPKWRIASALSGTFHLHGNGSPSDVPKYVIILDGLIEGNGSGILSQGLAVNTIVTGMTVKDNAFLGQFGGVNTTTITDLTLTDQGGGPTYSGSGAILLINPAVGPTAGGASLLGGSSATSGAKLEVHRFKGSTPVSWTSGTSSLISLPSTGGVVYVVDDCDVVGANSCASLVRHVGAGTRGYVRNSRFGGSFIYAPFFSDATPGTLTGISTCTLDDNDFSGLGAAPAFKDFTNGTDRPFRFNPTNKMGLAYVTRNTGNTPAGSEFLARPNKNPTAIVPAGNTVLDHDYSQYVLTPSAPVTVNNIFRKDADGTWCDQSIIRWRNTAAFTITLSTSAGNLHCDGGLDMSVTLNQMVEMIGDGAGGYYVHKIIA